MIIPPDPEKDPRLFSESTTSLVTVQEGELVALDEPALPHAAYHANPAAPSPYPYGAGPFSDDYAAWSGEALPPYDGPRRSRDAVDPIERAAVSLAPLQRASSLASSSSSSSTATASRSRLLRRYSPVSSIPASSPTVVGSEPSPKDWEGLTASSAQRRWHGIPLPPRLKIPVSPEARSTWRKYRRWWIALLILILIACALAVGLAAGFTAAQNTRNQSQKDKPWKDKQNHSGQNAAWQAPDLNLTYVPKRDGPKPPDGSPHSCNNFTSLNASSTLTQLAVSSPYFKHYITTFTFPLNSTHNNLSSLSNELYIIARGLAATGTVEFVGSNAPPAVINGGQEGVVKVDVIARYADGRDLTKVVQVCKMERADGGSGVGIYTPVETDGGAEGPSLLNPLYTPAFHVIIRLPPSVVNSSTTGVYFPGISLDLAQMGTRIGNWQNVALIGDMEVRADCRGGGVVADYIAAENLTIHGAENTVQGTFNVSSSLSINSTSGTILANVILTDHNIPNDNSSTVTSSIPMPHGSSRLAYRNLAGTLPVIDPSTLLGAHQDKDQDHDWNSWADEAEAKAKAKAAAILLATPPTNFINTSFTTNEGFIFVAYLHHPPSVALRSFISSQTGMVDVAVHPNYVGPFVLENLWGSIRLPPPNPSPYSGDPVSLGRSRVVTQGAVDVNNGTFFAANVVNMTQAVQAPNSVTGAALWSLHPGNASVKDVYANPEGRGNALVAVATLGDLQVTFDGT